MAKKMGGAIFSNVIAAGVIACILNIPKSVFENCIQEIFARKGEEIVKKDTDAGMKGYEIGKKIVDSGRINITDRKESKCFR